MGVGVKSTNWQILVWGRDAKSVFSKSIGSKENYFRKTISTVYIGKHLPTSKKVSSGMAIAKITSLAKIACLESVTLITSLLWLSCRQKFLWKNVVDLSQCHALQNIFVLWQFLLKIFSSLTISIKKCFIGEIIYTKNIIFQVMLFMLFSTWRTATWRQRISGNGFNAIWFILLKQKLDLESIQQS